MKISPIINYRIKENLPKVIANPVKNDVRHFFSEQKQSVNNPQLLKAYFINFKSNTRVQEYTYSPISSLTPVYEPLDCDYYDIEEFSNLYSKKIDSQLMQISKEDVENLILRLEKKTQAPKELIQKVLYKLTYFSTYSSLGRIQDLINYYMIDNFGSNFSEFNNPMFDTSCTSVLRYLASDKRQLDFSEAIEASNAVVLDDAFISLLEKKKNSDDSVSKSDYERIFYLIDSGMIKFLNIPGWDVKCTDGKYRSANFISGTGYLEQIALEVIKKVQKGEKLDDILYSDLAQRLEQVLNRKIKVEKVKIDDSAIDIDDIYNNLKNVSITSDDIKYFISKYFCGVSTDEISVFLEYLDKCTYVFSPDSYAQCLKDLFEKICTKADATGVKKEDIAFVVPDSNKSFAYIANVFAKINNINIENILCDLSPKQWEKSKFKQKHKIILDDISASGTTQTKECNCLEHVSRDSNVSYACLIASETAKSVNAECATTNLFGFKNPGRMLDFRSRGVINYIIKEHGYRSIASCCAFPYMIPDSNNDFASMLFTKLLYKNTKEANKGLDFVINHNREFYQSIMQNQVLQ